MSRVLDGNFYGSTSAGGTNDEGLDGTVFQLSMGLDPFVELQTSSGEVGTSVKILGNNLTGTTSVSFNGTPATSIKVTNTEIIAKVPSGATSGIVTVVTPSATLSSNVPFRITP